MADLGQQVTKEFPQKIEIIPNYVDESFESNVLELIPQRKAAGGARNQILRWGSNRPYNDHIVSNKIPDILLQFNNQFEFDSVTINEYYPNQYIDWHVDSPLDLKEIIIISLLSDAELQFRKNKEKIGHELLSFSVPRFSLTKFSEELRYDWQHFLKANKKRYSIVFRNSKNLKDGI